MKKVVSIVTDYMNFCIIIMIFLIIIFITSNQWQDYIGL